MKIITKAKHFIHITFSCFHHMKKTNQMYSTLNFICEMSGVQMLRNSSSHASRVLNFKIKLTQSLALIRNISKEGDFARIMPLPELI